MQNAGIIAAADDRIVGYGLRPGRAYRLPSSLRLVVRSFRVCTPALPKYALRRRSLRLCASILFRLRFCADAFRPK